MLRYRGTTAQAKRGSSPCSPAKQPPRGCGAGPEEQAGPALPVPLRPRSPDGKEDPFTEKYDERRISDR